MPETKLPSSDGSSFSKPSSQNIVLGPDGKPCRSCNSFAAWAAANRASNVASSSVVVKPEDRASGAADITHRPVDCPPDVEELGRSAWTLLHTMTANYPEKPSLTQQMDTTRFINLFGKMYPCWACARDFQSWIQSGHEPRVSNREEFGQWMCEAHNAVNKKLGKPNFDCEQWQQRWRVGWHDGRCD